jgi:UPF0716 family protein affecting phage T7 exclusion
MEKIQTLVVYLFMYVGCLIFLISGLVVDFLGTFLLGRFVKKIGVRMELESMLILKAAFEVSGVDMSRELKIDLDDMIDKLADEFMIL